VISVVVVTYSPGELLDGFLDSLSAATDAPYEVVLADNGSVDRAPERASERPEVRLLPLGGNLGYGRAANAGIDACTGELVVVANPDIVWSVGSLDALVAASERWPRAGSLGPLILTPTGELYPSARELPSLGRGIGHALCGWWWPSNPWTKAYRLEHEPPSERAVGWLSGSCLLLRREAYDAVGGFDPAYFMYFEDTDLGARLGQAGWSNVLVPDAVVTHFGGHATSRVADQMLREHHASARRYLFRRYSGWAWLPVRLGLRAGLAIRMALARWLPAVGQGARPGRTAPVELTSRRGSRRSTRFGRGRKGI
jgi:N-acetylglucosaminyl-diphospho-decaprenol L-rhamnosyltransferase